MNAKLSELANKLIDDLEAIPLPKYSMAWDERAVGLVMDAFVDASNVIEDSFRTAFSPHAPGSRWCSKCNARVDAHSACPHFAPYSQAP